MDVSGCEWLCIAALLVIQLAFVIALHTSGIGTSCSPSSNSFKLHSPANLLTVLRHNHSITTTFWTFFQKSLFSVVSSSTSSSSSSSSSFSSSFLLFFFLLLFFLFLFFLLLFFLLLFFILLFFLLLLSLLLFFFLLFFPLRFLFFLFLFLLFFLLFISSFFPPLPLIIVREV